MNSTSKWGLSWDRRNNVLFGDYREHSFIPLTCEMQSCNFVNKIWSVMCLKNL